MLFLFLFSYLLLCDFTYLETVTKLINNSSSNDTNSTEMIEVSVTQNKKPDWLEYLLLFWVISFLVEEIRQVN
jgi:hypothetical protein